MTTLEVLRAAREKVRQGWTQGLDARDRDGYLVRPHFQLACRWCAEGAVRAIVCLSAALQADASGNASRDATGRAIQALELVPGGPRSRGEILIAWNDAPGRTQAEVLALFDKAIAAEEARKV